MAGRCGYVVIAIGLLWGSQTVDAELGFFSYERYTYRDSVQYRLRQIGSVQLETSEITVVPRGAYLDITEDAWVSGNLYSTRYGNLTFDYLLKGGLPVPAKAVVTGLQVWHDDQLFQASLYPAQYNYLERFADTTEIRASLRDKLALLQKLGPQSYDAVFANLALGQRRHIRIRYLLPNDGSGSACYQIPVLFHTRGGTPTYTRFKFLADKDMHRYTLATTLGTVVLVDSTAYLTPYRSSYSVVLADKIGASLHSTAIGSGDWAGYYLGVNTELSRSVIGRLSHQMESMFIWRWNAPVDFVERDGDLKTLSGAGLNAVNQARSLIETMDSLTSRGHRVGLIHTIEGEDSTMFGMSGGGSKSYARLREYLSKFTEQYLYTLGQSGAWDRPDWAVSETPSSTKLEEGQREFVAYLKSAVSTFSADTAVLKHVVIVSLGSAPTSSIALQKQTVQDALGDATICAVSVKWRGVNFAESVPRVFEQGLQSFGGYWFPAFEPAVIKMEIRSGTQRYAFPFSVRSPSPLAVTAKASAPWSDTLTWTGYTPEGLIVGSASTIPRLYAVASDSGLVKIWAADESHVCEHQEEYLPGTYGFLSKDAYLKAGLDDRPGDPGLTAVPFLTFDGIYVPTPVAHPLAARVDTKAVTVSLRHGMLTLGGLPFESVCRVQVLDMRGRLLMTLDPDQQWLFGGVLRMEIGSRLRGMGNQNLIVCIVLGTTKVQKTVFWGGVR